MNEVGLGFFVQMCQNTKFMHSIACLKFFHAGIELKKKKKNLKKE